MIAVLGAASAFIGVFGIILYMSGSRTREVESRFGDLNRTTAQVRNDAPFADRVVVPVFSGVAGIVIELLPHSFVNRTSRQLLAAGGSMSTLSFFTIVTVTGILLPLAVLALFLLQSGGGVSTTALVVIFVAGVAGALLPFLWLRRAARARKLTIWKSLPDAFDLLTVSVEAGLGLDAALRHVSDKLRGPFSDEIRQTLREVGMGRSRREALEDLADRVDVEELTTFVNSVIQAEQLGTSLGLALRAQGASIRTKRRQKAEEMSRKAPVKMVFPLVLFIMPTFFIVVLGPLVVHLLVYLSE
jgi:tight adherence protein C